MTEAVPFVIEEMVPAEPMAGECSGGGCCLAAGGLDEDFVIEELTADDPVAGECSGGGCCLAAGNLDEG